METTTRWDAGLEVLKTAGALAGEAAAVRHFLTGARDFHGSSWQNAKVMGDHWAERTMQLADRLARTAEVFCATYRTLGRPGNWEKCLRAMTAVRTSRELQWTAAVGVGGLPEELTTLLRVMVVHRDEVDKAWRMCEAANLERIER